MYHYLSTHPSVFMPEVKEPHYFATDKPVYQRMKTEPEYLKLFADANECHRAVGEASVWYLHSNAALLNIRQFNPSARILIFLRNPIDFVQSIHSQHAFNSRRPPNFPAVWREANRREKLINQGSFGTQLDRARAIFPAEQILVILQDDLKADPRREYLSVLDFLDLPDDGREDFKVHNAHKVHRSLALGRFAKETPSWLLHTWRFTKRLLGIKQLDLMERLHQWNMKEVRRDSIDDELRRELRVAFASDISFLERQLNRDLSHWN